MESSTVDDSINFKKGITTHFVPVLENKATLNDLEHCSVCVLLSTRLGEVCSSDRIEKLWVQYFKLVAIIILVLIERHSDRNIQMHSVLLMIPYHILLYAFTMHDQLKCTSVHETLNLANVVGPDGMGTSPP